MNGNFFRRSRAANSTVLGRIWLKFELFRDIINVLLTCKYAEDPIKNEGARVLTRLYDVFFRRSRAANSEVSGGIQPKFQLIQAFIVVFVTCKNEEDPIKNFPHYKSMGIFSDAQGQLTPQPLVESGPIANSSGILWLSSLSASKKKIRSKMKALEC